MIQHNPEMYVRLAEAAYGRNPERGEQQLSERVENLLDEAGVVPSDPDRLRVYLVKLVAASYQAGRNSVNREASRR